MSDVALLVCMRITDPLIMPDNLIGTCQNCGWKIQFRPPAPDGVRLCFECVEAIMEENSYLAVTQETLDDLHKWFGPKLN
jgi:hypothetical protein